MKRDYSRNWEKAVLPDSINLLEQIVHEANLESAFEWLCRQRKNASHNDGVWHLWHHWKAELPIIQADLRAGTWQPAPIRCIPFADGDLWQWSARDALVLRAIARVLTNYLTPKLSEQCYHLAGKGGLKGAIRQVTRHLPGNSFVFKSDIQSYYDSISHHVLMRQLRERIPDPDVIMLLTSTISNLVDIHGEYRFIGRGISMGCPLSPLLGALYLEPLDRAMQDTGLFYARYMDDWVVLSPSRWKLRRAIKKANGVLEDLMVKKHPDKTTIGRIQKGFDFLGYTITPKGLNPSPRTIHNMRQRLTRLYEQGADENRIGSYVRSWLSWLNGGLRGLFHWGWYQFVCLVRWELGISEKFPYTSTIIVRKMHHQYFS